MINAEYGKPNCVRFENHLDENPLNLDRGDFGDPNLGFLTHLHNAHTASESDGNPHHKEEAYGPGGWVDNLYLNYPAGGDEAEKQSFFWYHDHREGHTGANVYKGMAGLYPIYDPVLDAGDETKGLRLPGVRTDHGDGSFDVDYDIPIVLGDVALDDGATPHQDFHNGCGEVHPEQWGKTFFRHFPNHGFVGDVFWVNGKAYPVLEVKRRKYRFRFLTAAIARQFELQFMKSAGGPKSAVSLGYSGTELQGQWRIQDGVKCLNFVQIASGGGLLPNPIVRDTIENWPAMRHEVIVDFTKYLDGNKTKKGDVIYLTNVCKMPDGRQATKNSRIGLDSKYKIPLLKIVIGDDAPDNSVMPTAKTRAPQAAGHPGRPVQAPDPDLRAAARRVRRRDAVAHQRPPVRRDRAARRGEAGAARGLDHQERRRWLEPPDAPPHGGAPRGHPEREDRDVGEGARGRHRQGRRPRARSERDHRGVPELPDLRGTLRRPLPQPRSRGPRHDVRLDHREVGRTMP